MNEQLKSRLENWKFNQAIQHLDGEKIETVQVVHALAGMFGDCGWGMEGHMETIIGAAVDAILDDALRPEA